jgi:hypothetical protein
MKIYKNKKTIIIKTSVPPLSFIKGTPVLPAVSKRDVDDIIKLLEELKQEEDFDDINPVEDS